jgi:riboflavin-specific deaminase-like protein
MRPRVIANFAITADGKVTTRRFTPTGFTAPADKRRLLEIRALGDALLVGAGTLAADTMSMRLTAEDLGRQRRAAGRTEEPLRVIVTNSGSLDLRGKAFAPGGAPRVIFSTRRMPQALRSRLAPLADLWLFPRAVDLPETLRILRHDYAVRTLVCEGGPTLFRALLEADLVDELRLTWAGVVFGGASAPTLTALPGGFLPESVRLRLTEFRPGDGEIYLTYRVVRSRRKPARRLTPGSAGAGKG